MRRHAAMWMGFVLLFGGSVSFAQTNNKPTVGKPAASASASVAPATAAASAAPSASGSVAAVPTAAAPAAAPSMDAQTYAVRLRDLESRVDELKDQIRRSHRRLSLLSDTILSGGGGGARADIVLVNEMSSAFRLSKAMVIVDGAVQFNKSEETAGQLSEQKEIPIYSGTIPSGDHTVNVVLNFQGNGYGVFTYLKGYKFEVKSGHTFTSADGKSITLRAIAFEDGGPTTPLDQRPKIAFKESIATGVAPAAASAPAAQGDAKGK
ncbi:MAG: hypothetical protein KBF88_02455 [Polyangiaceae bacterium]|nr:hypothetical protein [Polyangiaceae bacterium]